MSKENVKYPHQEVMEYYELSLDGLGKATRETVEQLNSKIDEINNSEEDDDDLVESMKETLAKSKLIAGVIIAENKKSDTEKEKAEVAKEVAESVQAVKSEIQAAEEAARIEAEAAEAAAAAEKEEEEEEEEEEVLPPPSSAEEKIQNIIDFFNEYKVATEDELEELGLKNFKGADEITLVPKKYIIARTEEGDYILKKKSGDGMFGWVLVGIGALVAGFFGYKYYKKNK